jgi:hypothetical protein
VRQELTIEIGAPRDAVWAALRNDLDHRGDHVRVLVDHAPAELEIQVHAGPGERLTLRYELIPLDETNTAVRATVAPAGPGYLVKRLLTFGALDRGYLDALAVGLANLQRHLEGEEDEP